MMLDLSPKSTYIDCSGDGHIIAHEIDNKSNEKQKAESERKV